MNEFIELRKSLYQANNPYIFPIKFLEKLIRNDKIEEIDKAFAIKKIKEIKGIEFKDILDERDLKQLISSLGQNEYLDRYIVDIMRKSFQITLKDVFQSIISEEIMNNKEDDIKVYHLLDISIEYDMEVIDDQTLLSLLEKYKNNFDMVSIFIDYIYKFKIEDFQDYLYKLLEENYPDNIKLQALEAIYYLYGSQSLDKVFVKLKDTLKDNKELFLTYVDFIKGKVSFPQGHITILQSMFYGDFEDSGKGNNGGLAILLKSLGNEMSIDKRISLMLTITINDKSDQPFVNFYSEKHVFARLPVYLDWSREDQFIKRELAIKRAIHRFLIKAHVKPDIFHIRFLDNASKAVDILSKELGTKIVFTLTPDPHRNMFDEDEKLILFTFEELIFRLNKIRIGDELIYRIDGIVGIGSESLQKELQIYFPQLSDENISKKIRMISEGIQSENVFLRDDSKIKMDEIAQKYGIDKEFFDKPIILNVGRLNAIKGQSELLKAWGNSELCRSHNLLIIGGDLKKSNKEEEQVIRSFKEYIDLNPQLKKNFYHLGAIANENIRIIEKIIIKKNFNYPHIYLCSSKKEEFGIAILEAVSEGFLIIGPIKGGVKSYIKNGVNGFLIDTSSWESIAKETEKILYHSNINRGHFEKISNSGKKTVSQLFSIERIAEEFLAFYMSIEGRE